MSHQEQTKFIIECLSFIKKEFKKPNVLEVGSYNVNSIVNYKEFIGDCNYLGIDLIKGPGVDLVMDGENIGKLNNKFDIIISAECFEHAENWKIIFQEMIKNINEYGYIILTIASKGRLEHGTQRTISSHSPGTGNYYLNLEEKDFYNNFDIDNIFEEKIFFYNIHSYDLYVIFQKENKSINIINQIKKLYLRKPHKTPKFQNVKRFIICSIIGDRNFQNLRYFFRKLRLKIFKK